MCLLWDTIIFSTHCKTQFEMTSAPPENALVWHWSEVEVLLFFVCFIRDSLEWVKCLVSLVQKLLSSHAWQQVLHSQLSGCILQLRQVFACTVSSTFCLIGLRFTTDLPFSTLTPLIGWRKGYLSIQPLKFFSIYFKKVHFVVQLNSEKLFG